MKQQQQKDCVMCSGGNELALCLCTQVVLTNSLLVLAGNHQYMGFSFELYIFSPELRTKVK